MFDYLRIRGRELARDQTLSCSNESRIDNVGPLACLLFNGPVQGESHSALRQRTCVRCGWRAYLHCTSMPSSILHPHGGGIIECAFYTTALYALLARPVQ